MGRLRLNADMSVLLLSFPLLLCLSYLILGPISSVLLEMDRRWVKICLWVSWDIAVWRGLLGMVWAISFALYFDRPAWLFEPRWDVTLGWLRVALAFVLLCAFWLISLDFFKLFSCCYFSLNSADSVSLAGTSSWLFHYLTIYLAIFIILLPLLIYFLAKVS